MKIGICAFTARGTELAHKITSSYGVSDSVQICIREKDQTLSDWTGQMFQYADVIIFVGACGIAVRSIAPYVDDKLHDPCVIVVDEMARHVIPILSGHVGGGNEFAWELAQLLDADPVITTATDLNGRFACDVWAKKQGLAIVSHEGIAKVSSKILKEGQISIRIDDMPKGPAPDGVVITDDDISDIYVAMSRKTAMDDKVQASLVLYPRDVVIGIGCKKDTDPAAMEERFYNFLDEHKIELSQVAGLASIDVKANEKAIIELAGKTHLPFRTYSAYELNGVEGTFTPSSFVASKVGVDNVCERSAMALGKEIYDTCKIVVGKTAGAGMTFAAVKGYRELTWDGGIYDIQ